MHGSSDIAIGVSSSGSGHACALRLADGEIRCAKPTRELNSTLAALCAECGVVPQSIAEVRVDVGPGSYTGLRSAVTFARFTASFGGARLSAVTSLELLALSTWLRGGTGEVARLRVVLDARRKKFHHALVGVGDAVELLSQPAATSRRVLVEAIGAGERVLGAEALAATIGVDTRDRGATYEVAELPADGLAALLFDARVQPREVGVAELEPLYLMGSYAEQAGEGAPPG